MLREQSSRSSVSITSSHVDDHEEWNLLCCLHHASDGFFPGLVLYHEERGNIFPRNAELHPNQTALQPGRQYVSNNVDVRRLAREWARQEVLGQENGGSSCGKEDS
jgi:hypothetical protein